MSTVINDSSARDREPLPFQPRPTEGRSVILPFDDDLPTIIQFPRRTWLSTTTNRFVLSLILMAVGVLLVNVLIVVIYTFLV